MYQRRRKSFLARIKDDVDSVIIGAGASMTYFTGAKLKQRERPTLLVLTSDNDVIYVVAEMNADTAIEGSDTNPTIFTYPDGPDLIDVARGTVDTLRKDINLGSPLGVDYYSTRLLEYSTFSDYWEWTDLLNITNVIDDERSLKEPTALEAMETAAAITVDIFETVRDQVEPGQTELEVDKNIRRYVLESEADGPGVITVTSGERTANPHGSSSTRTLRDGDLVMIDLGVTVDGYYSDMTRTFGIGSIDEELEEVYAIVRKAQAASREHASTGARCESLDRAARKIIEREGYGEYFPHRVGHGIGLEGHEQPYLVEGNTSTLKDGQVFTIEPGIYVPDVGGVRIEDTVALIDGNTQVITDCSRNLIVR